MLIKFRKLNKQATILLTNCYSPFPALQKALKKLTTFIRRSHFTNCRICSGTVTIIKTNFASNFPHMRERIVSCTTVCIQQHICSLHKTKTACVVTRAGQRGWYFLKSLIYVKPHFRIARTKMLQNATRKKKKQSRLSHLYIHDCYQYLCFFDNMLSTTVNFAICILTAPCVLCYGFKSKPGIVWRF